MSFTNLLERRAPRMSDLNLESLLESESALAESTGHHGNLSRVQQIAHRDGLNAALIAAEVDILTDDSVQAYQDAVAAEHQPEVAALKECVADVEPTVKLALHFMTTDNDVTHVFYYSVVFSLLGVVVCGFANYFLLGALLGAAGPLAVFSGAAFGLPFGFCVYFFVRKLSESVIDAREDAQAELQHAVARISVRSWDSTKLSLYEQEVPSEVLYKVQRLKELLPDARFLVHFTQLSVPELELDQQVWSLPAPRYVTDTDPFLEICYEGQKAFIAVWDEDSYQYSTVQDS